MFACPSCGAPNYFAAGAAALFVAVPELAGGVFSTLTTMQPVKKKAAAMTNAAPIRILFFIFGFLYLFQPQSRLVRIAGLEPAHLAALPPQSSVSANSTICAPSRQ